PDPAWLPRPREPALDAGALHDPRLDRAPAGDPPHPQPRDLAFAQTRRRDAPLPPRPQRGRTLLGPALRARHGAADRARQRAAPAAERGGKRRGGRREGAPPPG